ncbi:hypothetical protein BDFB_011517 [Asbolus verrucosus]|uniref:Uncharacterized protein n=1 Tax=Asbolus verrucosus TaxID=1661398 RepID=A0A482VEU3_ASBVE|nr:hypothetical protein BDFB_011517 [Asbolus verrucosus]
MKRPKKSQNSYSDPSVFNTPIFIELIKKVQNFPVLLSTTIRSILTASPLSRQLIPFISMCLSRRIMGTTIIVFIS